MITFRRLGTFGGFGNQLYQYAGTKLYAYLHGYKCAFPEWIGDDLFDNTVPYNRVQKVYSKILPKYKWQNDESDRIKLLYAQPKDNINIHSYMQDSFSIQMLYEHKELILKWLAFKKEIEDPVVSMFNEYPPFIAVHIRRGDFPEHKWSSTEKIHNAIKELNDKNYKLVICSDDKDIINEFSDYDLVKINNSFSHMPDHIFDFLLLKHADILIAGGSTFSWWAAYLGNKNNYYSSPLAHLWNNADEADIHKIDI